ncbi:MAG: hypothetical protein ACOYT4_05090 [Nanoarchaeota archaeon]
MIKEVILGVFNNPIYLLSSILIIGVLLSLILTLIKFRNKESEPENENLIFLEDVKRISDSKEELKIKLNALSNLAKNFFNKEFQSESNAGFSELINFFKKSKNHECASFCESMLITYYIEEDLTNERFASLVSELSKIIEKKIPKKKNKKKNFSFQNLKFNFHKEPVQVNEFYKSSSSKTGLIDQISRIVEFKDELEEIKKSMLSNKKIKNILERDFINEDFYRTLREDHEIQNESRKLAYLLEKLYKDLNILYQTIYKQANEHQKTQFEYIIKQWYKEQKNLSACIKNPLKKQIKESELFSKYLLKIISISRVLIEGQK